MRSTASSTPGCAVSAVSSQVRTTELLIEEARAREQGAPRRLGFGFWLAVGWMVLIILLAVLAPVLPLRSPSAIGDGDLNAGLFRGHNLFGTDDAGRDLLARTIFGARISLLIGFTSVM